jgi:hypothetical protein
MRVVGTLSCVYAPYGWLVFIDHPWDSYWWQWFSMWPVLPGLLVHMIPAVHRSPDWVGYLMMGAFTTVIVAPTVRLAWIGGRSGMVACGVAGLLSAANAWVAYQLFLF